jgi:hypothetical protein
MIPQCHKPAKRDEGESTGPFYDSLRQYRQKLIRFAFLPSSAYLFTVGAEGSYFHLIALRYTPQSVGLLWTRDRPVAEAST